MCFFFFQAEDGIRDADVTGVQTCALPISPQLRPDTYMDLQLTGKTAVVTGSTAGIRLAIARSAEHTSSLQSRPPLLLRLLLAQKTRTVSLLSVCIQRSVPTGVFEWCRNAD